MLPDEFEQVPGSILKTLSGHFEVLVKVEKQKYNVDQMFGAYLWRPKTPHTIKVRFELKSLPENDGHFRIYDIAVQVMKPKDETSHGIILD